MSTPTRNVSRGKTTPSSTAGSFTTHAHGIPDVSLDAAVASTPGTAEVDYAERDAAYRRLAELAYPADQFEPHIETQRLRSIFAPSAVVGQAHRIYDYMREHGIGVDSATREAAFAYAAIDTGRSYDDLYEAWLNEQPITSPCASCGTTIEVRLADATGRCSTCVGAYVREATRRRR